MAKYLVPYLELWTALCICYSLHSSHAMLFTVYMQQHQKHKTITKETRTLRKAESQLQPPVNIINELKIHVKNEKSLDHVMYRIRPNYRTACLVFFKITGKTCGKI